MRRLCPNVAVRCGCGVPQATGLYAVVQLRQMNINRNVQQRLQEEQQEASSQRSNFDIDKEKWSKQMKFATMDCIMDPDITLPRKTSVAGIRRFINLFVMRRRLKERRPDLNDDMLKKLFVELKSIWHARFLDDNQRLSRITTYSEASRIKKEIEERMNADFTKSSWKSLRMSRAKSEYEMEIASFELINTYMAQMAQEDWLQLTYRCAYKEKLSAAPDAEWVAKVEYPVFEVKLTDGASQPNNAPVIVVGVMKKDGTRYGRDAQDAQSIKKQFDKQKKWYN